MAKAWRLIKGQVGPRHNYREKHRSPTKCLAFEIKENTENIAEYRRKKLVSSLFFILIIFLFSAKSGGGGAKKWWGRGPTSPFPSAVPGDDDISQDSSVTVTRSGRAIHSQFGLDMSEDKVCAEARAFHL